MRSSITKIVSAAAIVATPAFAATDGSAGSGALLTAFLGFVALVVAFQFVPAMVVFGGMLRGLFTRGAEKESASGADAAEE